MKRAPSSAHGYFELYESLAEVTRAAFLQNPAQRTRVFVRFSTVGGGAGSVDLARDVRAFAVKFYTEEGNFDLLGNNIPVFFDAVWDFASLMPESMHMLTWAMSDRAIPRSYRMMEGFGVHTFRLVNAAGKSTFVKFHWRPSIGSQSVLWDEAVQICGADPDFHRRDLWEAIDAGNGPEYELGLQLFDETFAADFEFDVLDPTKLIPEELVPIRIVGKLVLDRNPDQRVAETEPVAFHPGHVVPGIDAIEIRQRTETFSDHYSQARLFFRSQTEPERLHIIKAFSFELGKLQSVAIRTRMLGHLHLIDPALGAAVENALRMEGKADTIEPARPPLDLPVRPSLSLLHKAKDTLKGRRVGVLVGDDSDLALLERLRHEVEAEGAEMQTVAPWVGGVKTAGGVLQVDHALVAAPSVFFDAVALVLSASAGSVFAKDAAAVAFARDAFGHLKAIGYTSGAAPLLEKAGIADPSDEGVISLAVLQSVGTFINAAKRQRVWAREPSIRAL